jgi:hypothetical protein
VAYYCKTRLLLLIKREKILLLTFGVPVTPGLNIFPIIVQNVTYTHKQIRALSTTESYGQIYIQVLFPTLVQTDMWQAVSSDACTGARCGGGASMKDVCSTSLIPD